jgi:hypothetical protein
MTGCETGKRRSRIPRGFIRKLLPLLYGFDEEF